MTANSPGEKRRRAAKRERERAAEDEAVRILRIQGASCSTCQNWIKSPVGRACDLDSDFYGYVLAKPNGLCSRWAQRLAKAS